MSKPANSNAAISSDARRSPDMARVWDPVVRLFHWSLAASFVVAYLSRHASADVHQVAGFAAAGLVVLRLVWGWLGTPYARFSQFVRHPATVVRYVAAIVSGREARHLGHNPAGGAMILLLMAAMIATSLTGWMMTTDTYFGVVWVETLHGLCGHGLLVLVLLHLGGVALASVRHRENLVRAMITGDKRQATEGDVA